MAWRRRRRWSSYTTPTTPATPAPSPTGIHVRREFSSWGEWVDAATAPSKCDYPSSRNNGATQDWDLGAGFDGAATLARLGWSDGLGRVRELTGALTARLASTLARIEWTPDVTGHVLDVGAYCAGEPEHWYVANEVLSPGAGQPIRIVFNATASAGVSADVLAAKGAAVCALVETLGLAGRPVRVDAVIATNHYSGSTSETFVTVKDFGAALDMDRLVFAIAHPAMLRRLWFGFAETWSDTERPALGIGSGYGCVNETNDKGDIYVAGAEYGGSQWTDQTRALAWVKEQLTKQGVQFIETGD